MVGFRGGYFQLVNVVGKDDPRNSSFCLRYSGLLSSTRMTVYNGIIGYMD